MHAKVSFLHPRATPVGGNLCERDSVHAVQACVGQVVMACDDISGDLIRLALRKCCILNALRGTEYCALSEVLMVASELALFQCSHQMLVLNAICIMWLFTIYLGRLTFEESYLFLFSDIPNFGSWLRIK